MAGIFGTPAVTNTSLYTGTTTQTGTTGNAELGKDAFLQLLVAQLKYQDPSSPTDSSQFMAQTAQFTLVEKMEELAKSQAAMVNAQNLTSATSLVGREITWSDGDATKSGVVTAVTMNNGTAQLAVGDLTVDLTAVTKVAPVGSGSAGSTA
jgi:flagellar basal-body rod modification protein FlgD